MAKKAKNLESVSDFNMDKVNPHQLSQHMAATLQLGGNLAVFGRRGSGKTEIAKQEIANAKLLISGMQKQFKTCYLNLSVLERVDLGGYPDIMAATRSENFVNFMLPSFYRDMMENKDNSPVGLILDEVDKCDPSLWAPLLELTQFRSINGTRLPNLHAVIMTGNLISEGGSRPSLPLLDRAEKYLVEPDSKSWLDWAGRVGAIHPAITSYVTDNPQHLFGVSEMEDNYASPSPRSWTIASNILHFGEKAKWDNDLLLQKVYGCVGKQVGLSYKAYFEHYISLMPLAREIMSGKKDRPDSNLETTKQLVLTMIVTARLAHMLDSNKDDSENLPKKVEAVLKNVGKYLLNVSIETRYHCIRSQISRDRLINFNMTDRSPEWENLVVGINKYLESF